MVPKVQDSLEMHEQGCSFTVLQLSVKRESLVRGWDVTQLPNKGRVLQVHFVSDSTQISQTVITFVTVNMVDDLFKQRVASEHVINKSVYFVLFALIANLDTNDAVPLLIYISSLFTFFATRLTGKYASFKIVFK